ncbi:IclR family transcriptional regulator [Paracoccus shanxieyensis]|nr:IclR family transcriptional regulator [Paracoccus shanxieyensis]
MASIRDRAVSILELLAGHPQGLALSAIADQLDMPRAAAHRVLGDLKDGGYVRQAGAGEYYRLTAKIVSLGFAYLAHNGVVEMAQPVLDRLAGDSGELARLAVLNGEELRWIAKAQGATSGLRYDPDNGAVVGLMAAANGHAWLACLDDDSAIRIVARQQIPRESFGPGAPADLAALLETLAPVRRQGYASVRDSYELGTASVAAAIRDPRSGAPVGTVSIAGPTSRMPDERLGELARLVINAAQELSALVGAAKLMA